MPMSQKINAIEPLTSKLVNDYKLKYSAHIFNIKIIENDKKSNFVKININQ